jgi:hypothetical protein
MSDSGERKQITINPDHFKIASSTRKKRNEEPKIKVKAPNTGKKERKPKASTLKRNLVKMLRNFQEEQVKQRKRKPSASSTSTVETTVLPDTVTSSTGTPLPGKSDFDRSIEFFETLEKSQAEEKRAQAKRAAQFAASRNMAQSQSQIHAPAAARHNFTYGAPASPAPQQPPIFRPKVSDITVNHPHVNTIPLQSIQPQHHPTMHVKPPEYGCLKNGTLPTYRTWKRQTQKQYPTQHRKPIPPMPPSPVQINYEKNLQDTIRSMSLQEKIEANKQKQRNMDSGKYNRLKKRKRQRRILRRTYRTGKSKVHPRVAVLVSNKTIRNNTNLRMTELKETPMRDVRQYLKKQGLIKVGTNTPNDVLRQMYECANLICGEVKNHNSENLLYNYFNDTDEF